MGLHLRAVGENPATADAAGINVTKYKYIATCVGGVIAGLGGLYFIMDYTGGSWTNGGFGDRGWLAIALVIFALWKPNIGIIGSFVFGGLYIAYSYIDGLSRSAVAIFNFIFLSVAVNRAIDKAMEARGDKEMSEEEAAAFAAEATGK